MTNTIKNTVAGIVLASVAMFGAVSSAKAQTPTIDSLMAQIAALTAQIAAMQGGSASATCGTTTYGYTATSTLKAGMKGASVSALQSALNMYAGASISTDGSFGPMTANAVKAFQTSKGLVADGIAGPATQGALQTASMMTGGACDNNDDSNDSSELNGDFGTINDVDLLSQYNNEEVGEGEKDVEVLGLDVEADSDGDIMIQSVKVSFDSTGNTGSDNFDDYVSEVTVWFDGEEVGSVDADDFSENGAIFSKTIALDSGVIIEADETGRIIVAVSAANSFDSSDISGDSWTVGVDSLRFVDGSGVVTTDATTGDLPTSTTTIDFVSYSAAADTELKISTHADSPEEDIVIVDDSSSTDNVLLLKGKLKLEGTSDVVIDEMPITFSPVGANINVMVESLVLVIDGEEYSETVPSIADGASASLTFDNLDFDLEAGDTVNFEVRADMTDMDGSIFAEGDTLTASLSATNRDYIDAENEEGDQLSDSTEKSGTANGKAQEFRTEGITLSLLESPSAVALTGTSANDDAATFTIKFSVEAIGETVYISSAATASLTTTGTGAVAGVERAGTATIGGVTVTIVNNTDTDQTDNGNFMIEEGDTENFTVTVTASLPTTGSAGQYRALLRALDWSTTDDAVIAGTGYTSNLDEFMTDYLFLN